MTYFETEQASTITIKDTVSWKNTTVAVRSAEELEDCTFYVVDYESKSSAEVDCTFAVIDYGGNMVCQKDWQGECASADEIEDFDWVDCTPNDDDDDDDDDELISVVEAAEILGRHRNRVLQLVNSGAIEGRKVGNTWYISRASVEARAANPPRAGRRW